MKTQLFLERFDKLSYAVTSALQKKNQILKVMSNLVGNFNKIYQTADAMVHINNGYEAVMIIDDGGDEGGADWYRKLHPQLISAVNQEKQAISEFQAFMDALKLKPTMEGAWQLNLETLAIKSGKIITNVTGNA